MRTLLILVALLAVFFSIRAYRERQNAILTTRYAVFYDSLSNGNMATAYDSMSSNYKERNTLEDFIGDSQYFDFLGRNPFVSVSIFGNNATLYEYETGTLDIYSGNVQYWNRDNGGWRFTGETQQFLD
jgi:hypothetical protein